MLARRVGAIIISLFFVLSLVACKEQSTDTIIYDKSGTFDKIETIDNATIDADSVILSNKTISGDLVINAKGLEGDVTLDNVIVQGEIIVNDPSDSYTIRMFDVVSNRIVLNNKSNLIKLYVAKATEINEVTMSGSVSFTEQNLSKKGFINVIAMASNDATYSFFSTGIEQLLLEGKSTAQLEIDGSSIIEELVVSQQTEILGNGTIVRAIVNNQLNSSINPDESVINNGGSFNGVTNEITTKTTESTTSKKTTKASSTSKVVTTTKKIVTTSRATTSTSSTTVTTTIQNSKPVITGTNVNIYVGNNFNPLVGVTIYDKEDGGYITVMNSHITSNNVNTNKSGIYYVEYMYVDAHGLSSTFKRQITVNDNPYEPTGVNIKIDENGRPVLYWNYVPGADEYDIHGASNSSLLETVSSRYNYYPLDIDGLTPGRTYSYGVRAIFDLSKGEFSDVIRTDFNYPKDVIDYPSTITNTSSAAFNIKLSPIGMKKDDYSIRFIVDALDSSIDTAGISFGGSYVTANNGTVTMPYSRDNGISFDVSFIDGGEYTIRYELRNSKNTIVESDDINIRVKGSTTGSNQTNTEVTPYIYSVDSSSSWRTVYPDGTGGEGVRALFYLDRELDLSDKNNSLTVTFFYRVSGSGNDFKEISFDYNAFDIPKLVKASDKYEINLSYYNIPVEKDDITAYWKSNINKDIGYEFQIEVAVKTKVKTKYAYEKRIILGDY